VARHQQQEHPDVEQMRLTDVMAALSDPIRVGLVRLLADGVERGRGELQAPVAKSTLSHHVSALRNAGIIRTRTEGTRCYVRLRGDDLQLRFPNLLDAVLAAADGEDVGGQVRLERVIPDVECGGWSVPNTGCGAN
jgi:DNA-binding transcriptional ArsR family regulator